ncbi:unnamed protein product [Psylliodes chrysocephalus]|uniref:Deltamethrin resistance protein prag01 domain-containing protein n=1 Tax=Psylliodes chrysocephalus TaxID=3402493 RepID=A0A9P0CMH2_9CUCU|nr:unnamed protein product [Psylliodes chrysocephala]
MYLRKLLSNPAIRSCTKRSYSSHYEGSHAVQSTYNDLPKPQGSWKTNYDANQRKYNAHLVLGIGALVGSIVFGKAAGLLEFYNEFPERPAVIASYK